MIRHAIFRYWRVGTVTMALAAFLDVTAANGAAVLLVNAVDADSDKQIVRFEVSLPEMRNDKVAFELQKDGRRRCITLPVDREMTVVVSADGYVPELEIVSLSSEATTEIELKLNPAVPKEPVSGWHALKSLGTQYRRQQDAYTTALRDAKSAENRLTASRNFAPQIVLIKEIFTFEERWRGTNEALAALQCLAHNANSSHEADNPLLQARERVGQILKVHYISHPQLDLILPMFGHSTESAVAESLFRGARRSPDPRVRACATYQLAVFLWQLSALSLEITDLREDASRRKDEEHFQRLTARQAWLTKIGFTPQMASARRQEAIELSEELQQHAASIRQRRSFQFLDLNPNAIKTGATFAELALRLTFAIEGLAVGSIVPEIDAPDPSGQPLKLSSFRGKVTVLIFSADWCASCVAMYPQLRDLVEKHGGDRFAVVSVMGDLTVDTVHKALADKKIIWPVWWDGGEQAISSRWGVTTWPTIFVIDHTGVIRHRNLSGERLTAAIDDLLIAVAADCQSSGASPSGRRGE